MLIFRGCTYILIIEIKFCCYTGNAFASDNKICIVNILKFLKGLTSWLSFVVSSVSLSLSYWYPGSGVVLDCIDS